MIVVDPDFVNADGAAASEWFNKKKKKKLFADNSTSQSSGINCFPPYPFSREFSAVHIS